VEETVAVVCMRRTLAHRGAVLQPVMLEDGHRWLVGPTAPRGEQAGDAPAHHHRVCDCALVPEVGASGEEHTQHYSARTVPSGDISRAAASCRSLLGGKVCCGRTWTEDEQAKGADEP